MSKPIGWRRLCDDWIAYKSVFVCERTIDGWYRPIKRNAEKYLPTNRQVITRRDATDFIAALQVEKLAPSTIKRRVAALSACWEWGIQEGLVRENPWNGLAKLIKSPRRPSPRPFNQEEVNKIISGFERHEIHYTLTPFVKFLFATGCRTGEAIGLRWSDVADDCGSVTISSQYTRGIRKEPKTGKIRTLYLPASIQQMLKKMKVSRHQNTLVFGRKGDRPIDDANFRHRAWISVLKSVGVTYRKPYNTRHTFISHALESGMSPLNISFITGHDLEVLCKHYAGLINRPIIPDIWSKAG